MSASCVVMSCNIRRGILRSIYVPRSRPAIIYLVPGSVGYRIETFDHIVRSRNDNIVSKVFRYFDNDNDKTINDNDAIKRLKAERFPGVRGHSATNSSEREPP